MTTTITLKFFAAYQEAYGVPEVQWTIIPGTSVQTLLDRCLAEHPELERWRSVTRFGVNWDFVPGDHPLSEGDEVVFIPPVSGG